MDSKTFLQDLHGHDPEKVIKICKDITERLADITCDYLCGERVGLLAVTISESHQLCVQGICSVADAQNIKIAVDAFFETLCKEKGVDKDTVLCEECKQNKASVCSECCQSIIGPSIVNYITKLCGHYPPTAADLVKHSELHILQEALHDSR